MFWGHNPSLSGDSKKTWLFQLHCYQEHNCGWTQLAAAGGGAEEKGTADPSSCGLPSFQCDFSYRFPLILQPKAPQQQIFPGLSLSTHSNAQSHLLLTYKCLSGKRDGYPESDITEKLTCEIVLPVLGSEK